MVSSSSLRHWVTTFLSLLRIAWSIVAVLLQHDLDTLGEQREQMVLQSPDRLLDLILGLQRAREELSHPHPLELDIGRGDELLDLGYHLGEQPAQRCNVRLHLAQCRPAGLTRCRAIRQVRLRTAAGLERTKHRLPHRLRYGGPLFPPLDLLDRRPELLRPVSMPSLVQGAERPQDLLSRRLDRG